MGSMIEINDTLQLTPEQGFPKEILNFKHHQKEAITINDIGNQAFEFKHKDGARVFHPSPTRCFLVENVDGKWLYWGKVIIVEQTISGDSSKNQMTSGKFKIIQIYNSKYQIEVTKNESPEGKSYF